MENKFFFDGADQLIKEERIFPIEFIDKVVNDYNTKYESTGDMLWEQSPKESKQLIRYHLLLAPDGKTFTVNVEYFVRP